MKKVSLLILVVVLLSTALMAATPTKLIRLTLINKTGADVYLKLESQGLTGQFYYLTVPSGDRDYPEVKVFTIMSDVYDRTTYTCGGLWTNTGSLIALTNTRLTFLPCNWVPPLKVVSVRFVGGFPIYTVKPAQPGEPTMEKVQYFKYFYYYNTKVERLDNNFWSRKEYAPGTYWVGQLGCTLFLYRIRTFEMPDYCAFRYQP